MKIVLGLLLVIGGLFAASTLIPNKYADCANIGTRHGIDVCKSKEKPVVKVVKKKKPILKLSGLSIKELEALAVKHKGNASHVGRIERRIMFLKTREAELKQVRKEIEYGALKSEFERLKFVRENYNLGSPARNLINDTLRAIKVEIIKWEIGSLKQKHLKPQSRKPASLSGGWNPVRKRNFTHSFKKVCSTKLPFTASQCNYWAKCAVNLFEEAYPSFTDLLKDSKENRSKVFGGSYMIGRICGARVINNK